MSLDAPLRDLARATPGFMPEPEGLALYEAGLAGAAYGPLLEVGSYCGKSTVYLGAAAAAAGTTLVTVDHHRGSEEHQPGWDYHDPTLVDPVTGEIDTLPFLRRTVRAAGLEDAVVAVVARSAHLAALWAAPLGLVFIDGSHTEESARADYAGWAPHVAAGGLLAIHDVFADPVEGGQAPRRIHDAALASGAFEPWAATGTLRVLTRPVTAGHDPRPWST